MQALFQRSAQKENAEVIIISNNNTGKAIAPRLSVRLKAGVGSGVSRLPLSLNPFTVYKRTYSGNAFAHLVIKSDVKILTLAQNSFDLVETPGNATIENLNPAVDGSLLKTVCKRCSETDRKNTSDRCRYCCIRRKRNEITR